MGARPACSDDVEHRQVSSGCSFPPSSPFPAAAISSAGSHHAAALVNAEAVRGTTPQRETPGVALYCQRIKEPKTELNLQPYVRRDDLDKLQTHVASTTGTLAGHAIQLAAAEPPSNDNSKIRLGHRE